MRHSLKIKHENLHNLLRGGKNCEIRYNDRDYQKDDILEFWDSHVSRFRNFKVTHIHSGLGMADNYVSLSVKLIKDE